MAAFESDGKPTTPRVLFLRGALFVLVTGLVVTMLVYKSRGSFDETVDVTATLVDVGDGLPVNSDVKFRGIIVGAVARVSRSADGTGINDVSLDLEPSLAAGIPKTVTARVVPSNVFAVSSLQLIDNGVGPALTAGADIPEDRSQDTVRLQTTLSRARDIVAAAGRDGTDSAIGMLDTLARATQRRGADIAEAGKQLDDIMIQLNGVISPAEGGTGTGTRSTLQSLSASLDAMRTATPDLLDALHNSVVPLQAVAEQKTQLQEFLAGGLGTSSTARTALQNNTDKLISITTHASAPLAVLADGSSHFTQMTRSLKILTDRFHAMWDPVTQSFTAKVIVSLTPNRQYTAADCQRYGSLEAPSCTSGPTEQPQTALPPAMDPRAYQPPDSLLPPAPIGGSVGPVGSAQEQQQIADILGDLPNAASTLLFGPLARGNTVTLNPVPGPGE